MRPRVLNSRTPEFKKFLAAIRSRRGGDNVGLDSTVAKIIEQVRKRGDSALIELTAKFDRVKLTAATIRVTSAERRPALESISAADRRALELAARRIADFHRRTIEKSFIYRDRVAMRLGPVVQPATRVGTFVPSPPPASPSPR